MCVCGGGGGGVSQKSTQQFGVSMALTVTLDLDGLYRRDAPAVEG